VIRAGSCSARTLEIADQAPAGLVQGCGDESRIHRHAEVEAHSHRIVSRLLSSLVINVINFSFFVTDNEAE
jgi:hypothetical protein